MRAIPARCIFANYCHLQRRIEALGRVERVPGAEQQGADNQAADGNRGSVPDLDLLSPTSWRIEQG